MANQRRLPQVHFGPVGGPKLDWRKHPSINSRDDDVLRKPSPDVIRLLGFDPTKLLAGPHR